jgi:hypothetical protein
VIYLTKVDNVILITELTAFCPSDLHAHLNTCDKHFFHVGKSGMFNAIKLGQQIVYARMYAIFSRPLSNRVSVIPFTSSAHPMVDLHSETFLAIVACFKLHNCRGRHGM